MQWDRKNATSQAHELREKGVLTFDTREELIEASANILTLDYLEGLEHGRTNVTDEISERNYWDLKIVCHVIPYRDLLKSIINQESKKKFWGREKKKILISRKHRKITNFAFMILGKVPKEDCGIPFNVTYVINLQENKLQKVIR